MSTPRVRIAPSPTGNLHIGTARTALFNYLFAKRYGGSFVLRIEDTDLLRSDKKYERDIFEGLRWLGIVPDEGPEQDGRFAPYRQTERIADYVAAIKKLLAEGHAFYCFHSEAELVAERQQLMGAKQPPIHICEFRSLDAREAEILTATKQDYIIRFKTPLGKKIVFHDLIRGELSFDSDLLGDFSIAKRIDIPLYNFAVVVDDHAMQITHIIRGEDHIPNTPKQLLLIEALGFAVPEYAHLPLILGPDRSKLSKRHGATSIIDYKNAGYLPEALVNFIALLGWSPGNDREIMSHEELISSFSLEKIQKSGAIFDVQKLDWMNGEYIRAESPSELLELALPFLNEYLKQALPNADFSMEYLEQVVALEQPRLKKLLEIGLATEYFFRQPTYEKELLRWKTMDDPAILASLKRSREIMTNMHESWTLASIESAFLVALGEGSKGQLLWPLRVALSGRKASPGPFEILTILGKQKSVLRIEEAIKKFS